MSIPKFNSKIKSGFLLQSSNRNCLVIFQLRHKSGRPFYLNCAGTEISITEIQRNYPDLVPIESKDPWYEACEVIVFGTKNPDSRAFGSRMRKNRIRKK